MEKLLAEGRSDLLDGFVSSRTHRKFKAYLVRQPDGKVGFEFEARPEKPARKTPAKTAPAAAAKTAAKKSAAKQAVKKTPAKKAAKKAAA
jgi:DNA topoisomerase-3